MGLFRKSFIEYCGQCGEPIRGTVSKFGYHTGTKRCGCGNQLGLVSSNGRIAIFER